VGRSYFDVAGLKGRCTVVAGELENFELQLRIMNEYQIQGVIHLAAQTQVQVALEHPMATLRANINGTYHILEAARQCRKYLHFCIVASTDKAYGEARYPQYDEDHPLLAVYPYDVSKACADMLARSYALTYDLPIAITRCGNFFGPCDLNWGRIIPHLIESYSHDRRPTLRSDGSHVRDYFYIKDGALAYLFLADKVAQDPARFKGEAFNFSYGESFSVRDIVHTVARLMGKQHIEGTYEATASQEIAHQSLDAKKARQLGWIPKYSIESGLVETIAWHREWAKSQLLTGSRL
jgi:CDP-glucose 4,6-dehydratase